MAWSIVLHEDFTAVNVNVNGFLHEDFTACAPSALLHIDRYSFFCF